MTPGSSPLTSHPSLLLEISIDNLSLSLTENGLGHTGRTGRHHQCSYSTTLLSYCICPKWNSHRCQSQSRTLFRSDQLSPSFMSQSPEEYIPHSPGGPPRTIHSPRKPCSRHCTTKTLSGIVLADPGGA